MIPKKPRVIIKQVSEELDISETLVDDIVSFYYKELRSNLSSLEHIKINVPGLGAFVSRKVLIAKLINKFERVKNARETDTFTKYHNIKVAEKKLEKLRSIQEKVNAFLKEKKEFKDAKYAKQNLEE